MCRGGISAMASMRPCSVLTTQLADLTAAYRVTPDRLTSSSLAVAPLALHLRSTYSPTIQHTTIEFWCSRLGPLCCLSTCRIFRCSDSTHHHRPCQIRARP